MVANRRRSAAHYTASLKRKCFRVWVTFAVTRQAGKPVRKQPRRLRLGLHHNERTVAEFAKAKLLVRARACV